MSEISLTTNPNTLLTALTSRSMTVWGQAAWTDRAPWLSDAELTMFLVVQGLPGVRSEARRL